jgi:hypothetical protein
MIFTVVIVVIVLLCFALVVAIAKDRGPTPVDVAVSYETAWDRLDFDVLWSLSAAELRDGLARREFVDQKRAAYANQRALSELGAEVTVEDSATRGDVATVTTNVALCDRSSVRNRVVLVKRTGRWQVVAYQLAPDHGPHTDQGPLAEG